MAEVLTHVSDRYKAFALWQAGLLVNSCGLLWEEAEDFTEDHEYNNPDAEGFVALASDWNIILEE